MDSDETMMAWRVSDPRPIHDTPLTFAPVAIPRPGAGELLVEVRACGVCRTLLPNSGQPRSKVPPTRLRFRSIR